MSRIVAQSTGGERLIYLETGVFDARTFFSVLALVGARQHGRARTSAHTIAGARQHLPGADHRSRAPRGDGGRAATAPGDGAVLPHLAGAGVPLGCARWHPR